MGHLMQNPIIPGFYPDPSIIRVEEDYYLVCSSFELCPAIPLFHSRDLVHWEQLCYVMTPRNGFHMEKNTGNGGVMAPTIRYHDGTFYVINANFSDKGNFIVTATDPAGPWSQPHWLDDVPGIDASIFFDDDGQCYIMGTGDVWPDGNGGKRQGIWAAKYDMEQFKMAGEPVALWGGALSGAASPEAPHLFHIGDWYYLLIAEGGTEFFHSVTVARSRTPLGEYEGYRANPILTHRHMGQKAPIQNVGHADFVELPDGSWYAVFLGSRLIGGVSKNLGRETFIAPLTWENGWPLIAADTGRVEDSYPAPACLPWTEFPAPAERDRFDGEELDLRWSFWGKPYEMLWTLSEQQGLILRCVAQKLVEPLRQMGFNHQKSEEHYAAFVAARRTSPDWRFTTEMTFAPGETDSAGIAVMQAMNHQLHLEMKLADGVKKLQLLQYTSDYNTLPFLPGFTSETHETLLAETAWDADTVVLQMELHQNDYVFRYGPDEAHLTELGRGDGFAINPEKVGCMVGEMVGMFASGNGTPTGNYAAFRWAETKAL